MNWFCCFLILAGLTRGDLAAQGHTAENQDSTVRAFVDAYNGQEYDAVFDMFAGVMKEALPLQAARDFFSGLYRAYGPITDCSGIGKENSFSLYKTEFGGTVLLLKLSADRENRIDGLSFEDYTGGNVPERSVSVLCLPFEETWYVFWGGQTAEENYHAADRAQRGAFDFVIRDTAGKSFRGSGSKNEDYYAYGKTVLSPCDGTVVAAVDGIKDNEPGRMNPYYAPGNSVIIRTSEGEYVLIGHMIPHSITVREGEELHRGTPVAKCGNSGNSSEPHIHIHMQDREDMGRAEGIRMYFSDIVVNGEMEKEALPVRGSYVRNR